MGIVRPRPAMVMGGLEDRKIKARLAHYEQRLGQLMLHDAMTFKEARKVAFKEARELKFTKDGKVKQS